MARDKADIKGVIVSGAGLNVDAVKESVRKRYEVSDDADDKYAKARTVEFEDIMEEGGSRYVNFWVS